MYEDDIGNWNDAARFAYWDMAYDMGTDDVALNRFENDNVVQEMMDFLFVDTHNIDWNEFSFNEELSAFEEYLWEEYNIEFDDYFDWDEWRDSYESSE